MNNKKNRKGFTIVELSIVVAVIAILAAVMIPVFSNITADARLAATRQNARSIYSNYVNAYIADETKTAAYDTTCWVEVESGKKYVKIINGAAGTAAADYATTAPTECYLKSDLTWSCVVTGSACTDPAHD